MANGLSGPGLRAGVGAVGEIGSEVVIPIGDEVVRAETAGAGNLKFQVAVIGVRRTVARRVIDCDTEGTEWGIASARQIQTEPSIRVGAMGWRQKCHADARFRAGEVERERCVRATRVDEAVAAFNRSTETSTVVGLTWVRVITPTLPG